MSDPKPSDPVFLQLLALGIHLVRDATGTAPIAAVDDFFPAGAPAPDRWSVDARSRAIALEELHAAAHLPLGHVPAFETGRFAGVAAREVLSQADDQTLSEFLSVVLLYHEAYAGRMPIAGAYLGWAINGAPGPEMVRRAAAIAAKFRPDRM